MKQTMISGGKCVRFAAVMAVFCAIAHPIWGVNVVLTAPGTTVTLGHPYGDLEFNNPLAGGETVAGLPVLEWRDAGWTCPAVVGFEDWTVSDPCPNCSPVPNTCIDGYANEIWLRFANHSATTVTTVPSTAVSVHLHGDNNDGIVEVFVDGVHVATLDMWTGGTDNALVLVTGLPNITHTIEVVDVGPTQQGGASGDDIALMGAAALFQTPPFWKADQPNYAPSGMPDFDQKQDQWAHEILCGPNLANDSVPLGDDVLLVAPPPVMCSSPDQPVVGKGPNGLMETPLGGDDAYRYEYCAPTALANCLWWFDAKFEEDPTGTPCDGNDTYPMVTTYPAATDDHCPDNVNTVTGAPGQQELVEDLAKRMDTGGQRTGVIKNGTSVADMEDAANTYLTDHGLADDYLVRLVRGPEFGFLSRELERSQDLVLALSFVQTCQGSPVFVGGHAVTMAGFNAGDQQICISDPYFDNAEAGGVGRVRPPVSHPHTGPPETLHNDAEFVSHDCYATQPGSPPYGNVGLTNFGNPTDEPTGCDDVRNFLRQNAWDPDDPAYQEPGDCDPGCPVETVISYVLEVSPFLWKERGIADYAPSGVPDFDQKQAPNLFTCPLDGSWSYCGPTAVANSMWWFDSVREGGTIPPPTPSDSYPLITSPMATQDDHDTPNVVPSIDDLAVNFLNTDDQTPGFPPRGPFCGTYIDDMERGIKDYLGAVGLQGDFYVHKVRSPTFEWVAREIERSQDVILLLGFWQLQDLGGPTWVRVGGHYVTSAGVDRAGGLIAVSDPFLDHAEVDPMAGLVQDGILLPHLHPVTPPDGTHNDAGNVSHDIYPAVPTNSPGGVWGPEGYSAALGPGLDNFEGQNSSDDLDENHPSGPPTGQEPIVTEVDYALAVSPCPWLFEPIAARGYCSGNPTLACGVDADCPVPQTCLRVAFEWTLPLAYDFAHGSFMSAADIGIWAPSVVGAGVGTLFTDGPPDPASRTGTWYLFKPVDCGSWQTAPGAEPDRDLFLP